MISGECRLHTELQNIANGIDRCCLQRGEDTADNLKSVYIQVYEVIIQCYDQDDSTQRSTIQHIIHATNATLVRLFHKHIRHRDLSMLSTWLDFLNDDFQKFRKFYHTALSPLIVYSEDQYTSLFMKATHHPFQKCVSQLQKLYDAHSPLIQCALRSKVQNYIAATKHSLLHSHETNAYDGQNDVVEWEQLKAWFGRCDELRLDVDRGEWLDGSLLFYLPTQFGRAIIHQCVDFYRFFHTLYDKCEKHLQLFRESITDDDCKGIAVEICCRYDLYKEWSTTKVALYDTVAVDTKQEHTLPLFYWQELCDALLQQDEKTCKSLMQVMCDHRFRLSRFKLFNIYSRQSLLSLYVVHILYQLPRNKTLMDFVEFVKSVIFELSDEPQTSRVIHLTTRAIHSHFFDDQTTAQQHQYLLQVCVAAEKGDLQWNWFRLLWVHTNDKDVFLQQYIDVHLRVAIARRSVNIQHEDTFLLLCAQKCQDECPTQLHIFRTLLNEYYHRSVDPNTFVVNQSVWSVPKTMKVSLHAETVRLLQSKTVEYHKRFCHRSVKWCLNRTRCTITFIHPVQQEQTVQICANVFAINLLLWIHTAPNICVGEWVDQLLQDSVVNRTHLRMLYKHLDLFLEQGIIASSASLSSRCSMEHNDGIRLSLIYYPSHEKRKRRLTKIPDCLQTPSSCSSSTPTNVPDCILLNRKEVVQASIIHTLKPFKEPMSTSVLLRTTRNQVSTFTVDEAVFQDALHTLIHKDYVCECDHNDNRCLQYIP